MSFNAFTLLNENIYIVFKKIFWFLGMVGAKCDWENTNTAKSVSLYGKKYCYLCFSFFKFKF